jgi:glutamine amidotransferase/cyclase
MAQDATVTLLDYGAGNVLSVVNAIKHLGYAVNLVERPEDITRASVRVFIHL